jgi:hypothetical protein
VWRLGGGNLNQDYAQMVRGYQTTSKDVIISISATGNTVSVTFVAHQTNGPARTYRMQYVVSIGIIVSETG